MEELLYKDEVYAIVGAAIEVHKEMGPGFHEPVYQECMEIELQDRGVPFVAQEALKICYKNRTLEKKYEPDFLCFDKIIVEIKALNRLTSTEESQLLNYLKASRLRVGLLINFGSQGKLEWKRFIR